MKKGVRGLTREVKLKYLISHKKVWCWWNDYNYGKTISCQKSTHRSYLRERQREREEGKRPIRHSEFYLYASELTPILCRGKYPREVVKGRERFKERRSAGG